MDYGDSSCIVARSPSSKAHGHPKSLPQIASADVGCVLLGPDFIPAMPTSARRCGLEGSGITRGTVLQPFPNLKAMPDQRADAPICLVTSNVARSARNWYPGAVNIHVFTSMLSSALIIEAVHLHEAVGLHPHLKSKSWCGWSLFALLGRSNGLASWPTRRTSGVSLAAHFK
jgi:hypothetical protein